jgi:hypothetical protein
MAIAAESHMEPCSTSGVAEQRILRLHIFAALIVAEPAERFVANQ